MASFDAPSEAPSDATMKFYVSENASFAFCIVTVFVKKSRSMLFGKFTWQRWTTHKWPRSALLAHPEISNEKIWYRKNEKLFDDQQGGRCFLFVTRSRVSHARPGCCHVTPQRHHCLFLLGRTRRRAL